jgi:thioredoxin-related protein
MPREGEENHIGFFNLFRQRLIIRKLHSLRRDVRDLNPGRSSHESQEIHMRNIIKLTIITSLLALLAITLTGCGGRTEGSSSGTTQIASSSGDSPVLKNLKTHSAIDWNNFNDGLAEAENSDKPILVFVSTTWCSYCRKMREDTFADDRIINRLKDSFVAVAIDGDAGNTVRYKGRQFSEKDFTRALRVRGFPTTIFFDSGGEIVFGQPGYIPPEQFEVVLEFISEGAYKEQTFQDFMKSYQAG